MYLNHMKDIKLILGADTLNNFGMFVDVAYTVHNDMKSHTGGVITFGTGMFSSKLSKQKLNIKRSTKGDIVGMSNYLTYTI